MVSFLTCFSSERSVQQLRLVEPVNDGHRHQLGLQAQGLSGPAGRRGLIINCESHPASWNIPHLLDQLWPAAHIFCTTVYNNINRFTALCSGLPGWASTRRNTHPPTILIITTICKLQFYVCTVWYTFWIQTSETDSSCGGCGRGGKWGTMGKESVIFFVDPDLEKYCMVIVVRNINNNDVSTLS